MQRTIEIDITGTYQNLDALVVAQVLANGEPKWLSKTGFVLEIYSPRTNASGTRIQVSSDFKSGIPSREILPESMEPWTAGGATHNSVSMLDKQIRILDAGDLATTGKAVVSMDWA